MDKERRLRAAIDILKEHGAKRIVLFGSMAKGTDSKHSDIDLACEGIPPAQFFKVLGEIFFTTGESIDLVDMREVKESPWARDGIDPC
ncbi:nucleotidyltransferase domain-containing protein [Candidatus Acetothermia bacterium]|jgi:predicted nucleotidyltransferase|nr:nucleotidyltransferase domain-containing protein [Candidatus Acetothermia bacterium]MCI2427686.1 nucleotidyltransferase domain-containing protein [Candidatus Acetothermia bacterium]